MLCRSPRREGNTNTVARWVRAVAAVTEVDLAHLKYKVNGCTACMGCQARGAERPGRAFV